jgi:hypothetical protein
MTILSGGYQEVGFVLENNKSLADDIAHDMRNGARLVELCSSTSGACQGTIH